MEKKGKITVVVLVLLMTVSFLMTGTYSCASIRDAAVYLSWLIYGAPLVLAWLGVIAVMRINGMPNEKQHKKGPIRLMRCGVFAGMFAAAAIFSSIWFMVNGTYDSLSSEIGLLVRILIQFAAAAGLALAARRMAAEYPPVAADET